MQFKDFDHLFNALAEADTLNRISNGSAYQQAIAGIIGDATLADGTEILRRKDLERQVRGCLPIFTNDGWALIVKGYGFEATPEDGIPAAIAAFQVEECQ